MVLGPVEYGPLAYIVANMRRRDCEEIFATRYPLGPDGDTDALIQTTLDAATRSGVGWLASRDGEPIAVIGISMLWPGVASVWMYSTDSFHKIALPLTKWAKKTIVCLMNDADIHRAHCWSAANHVAANRWLRFLGATEECTVPNYGRNGETFRLYGWSKGRDF